MPTVTRTWSFTEGTEALVDGGNTTNITVTTNIVEGSVEFDSSTRNLGHTEYARSENDDTWETHGVPTGATVTACRVTAWSKKVVTNTANKLFDMTFDVRFVNAANTNILDATEMVTYNQNVVTGIPVDANFVSLTAGSNVNVLAGSQSSTSVAKLEIDAFLDTTNTNGAIDVRMGAITVEITYTDPPPPTVNTRRILIIT